MKIRGALFDKDGTLIDFDRTWQPIVEHLVNEMTSGDAQRSRELMAAIGYDEKAGKFAAGSIFAAGNTLDLVDAWHPDLPANERAAKVAWYDTYFSDASPAASVPLTDLKAFLSTLQQMSLKLGIATNDVTRSATAFAEAAGLSHYFDFITGYDGVPKPKPAGDMIWAFCEATGLEPAEIAMVGDNTHDLETAVAGGAGHKVGVLTGSGFQADLEALADVVLPGIDALPDYLAELNGA